MTTTPQAQRYTSVAIALHWTIAVLIIANLAGGLLLESIPQGVRFAAYQWHKTLGILVLALTIARVAWRIMNPPPPLPEGMGGLQTLIAHVTHWAFYGLMLAIPLSGWAMVSASTTGVPTILFNVLAWPDLPLPTSEALEDVFYEMHEYLGFAMIGLLALHVAAALKHQIIDKDALMARVAPGLAGPARPPAKAGFGASLAFSGAFLFLAAGIGLGQAAPSQAAAPAPTLQVQGGGPVASGSWAVDPQASSITFSGTNAGRAFTGTFESWSATITFAPEALDQARAEVRVATASARTGDAYNDGALQEPGWFDPTNHPEASFIADTFRAVGPDAPDAYEADGVLTLKGVEAPVTLAFTLRIEGDTARATGETTVERLAFGIGQSADPTATWVSNAITIAVDVTATRQP